MDTVTVIGMDWGDKNHKAVVLAADARRSNEPRSATRLTRYRSFWTGIQGRC